MKSLSGLGRTLAALAFASASFTRMGGGTAEAAVVVQNTTIYSDEIVVWRCGKLYYQPYNGPYVQVYVKT